MLRISKTFIRIIFESILEKKLGTTFTNLPKPPYIVCTLGI